MAIKIIYWLLITYFSIALGLYSYYRIGIEMWYYENPAGMGSQVRCCISFRPFSPYENNIIEDPEYGPVLIFNMDSKNVSTVFIMVETTLEILLTAIYILTFHLTFRLFFKMTRKISKAIRGRV